jgi:hypothetical protein
MGTKLTYIDLRRGRVAILRPVGSLNEANYENLIACAWLAHQQGARHVIVDLAAVAHVGAAGLVALHTLAQLTQGTPPDPEAGWAAIRALAEAPPLRSRLPVLNARPQLKRMLSAAPYSNFLSLPSGLGAALAEWAYPAEAGTFFPAALGQSLTTEGQHA